MDEQSGARATMHASLVSEALRDGVRDYRYLLERGYSEVAALKLVGDRRQLDAAQRSMLYRGVSPRAAAAVRRAKLTTALRGFDIAIDGLNVIYTMANYLYGRPLFIADDGLLRDAGEIHGHDPAPGPGPTLGDRVDEAVKLLLRDLGDRSPRRVLVYLDEQVSRSGELASRLRRGLRDARLQGDAQTLHSPDYVLKRVTQGIIATSDSVIIDAARALVFDLARAALREAFGAVFIDIGAL